MQSCFDRLKRLNCFRGMEFDEYIENLVNFYCITNLIHPFREGNGRTQRLFLAQLAGLSGYTFDLSEDDADELMIATIQAANGVTDNLKAFFERAITPN